MSILDKTFTGIKKVIKCLILSCFYVNILYVSVVLAKPPHEYLSNAFKSVLKNFEENPRMLIPGGSILLIDYDKSKSISQDTEPIEQISQPFVNTPPASATVNVSPNNLLRDSCDNCGTDSSDQNTDSLVERNDVPHIYSKSS